ncbi:hypothetical protein [Roseixanthobacter liquoris]|uniref:hypothetical protein n=1 Tax=Roseixanthobacter liquoris TaxID=3119921 RepID=UPI0037270A0F
MASWAGARAMSKSNPLKWKCGKVVALAFVLGVSPMMHAPAYADARRTALGVMGAVMGAAMLGAMAGAGTAAPKKPKSAKAKTQKSKSAPVADVAAVDEDPFAGKGGSIPTASKP